MDTMPEKWYCDMNFWDVDRASCDAPEDEEDEEGGGGGAGISSQLIMNNSKSASTLSYRRLMFNQDGRLRPVYSEKNKFGFGVFSYSEIHTTADSEDYVAPTRSIGYWWSSLYDETGGSEFFTDSKRHPAVGIPGSRKEPAAPKDTASVEWALDVSSKDRELPSATDCFDFSRSVSVQQDRTSSGADAPRCIASGTCGNSSSAGRSGSYLMVAAYRKMHGLTGSAVPGIINGGYSKCVEKKTKLSVKDIVQVQKSVVRSCILAAKERNVTSNEQNVENLGNSADGSRGLSLYLLWETLSGMKCLKDIDEACRACMTLHEFHQTIHLLEEDDELRVTLSNNGDICVHSLKSLRGLLLSRKANLASSEHRDSLDSSRSVRGLDPMLGTIYFWGGPKDPIDLSRRSADIGVSEDVFFPAVRPPLKLRKAVDQFVGGCENTSMEQVSLT